MKILIGCEFSARVRDAFIAEGHDAWSCDIIRSEGDNARHIQDDISSVLRMNWDMMIAFPPCTFLANSGSKHLYSECKLENGFDETRMEKMRAAAMFFKLLLKSDIPKIALENPVMHSHARQIIGVRQTQTIQPWMFGHKEQKLTCLWLKNLPNLTPTENVKKEMMRLSYAKRAKVHCEAPGPDRQKNRSRTYQGVALAMAKQWGK